ncbi:hypothetical protein MUK42_15033 [Musa troglodytarum]|uniref:Uncharacterized protein n=1 Tax=Musa troglodytarum TaxID=320322 RepID=A0A9E7L6G2_9LILI|nr:hypothetical protein MUK42_15033 [Musa troglodytarum]
MVCQISLSLVNRAVLVSFIVEFRDHELFHLLGGRVPVPAKKKAEKVVKPLFEKWPKQFVIGGALPLKRGDLYRRLLGFRGREESSSSGRRSCRR